MQPKGKYTVNEVEERTGVAAATLRQWERRYGFPQPERSGSGYRLYADDDLQHIAAMKRHIDDGVPASRAAEMVRATLSVKPGPRPIADMQNEVLQALMELDEERVERILGEAHALHPFEAVVLGLYRDVMIELGERWHAGEISTTAEHFASSYLQGRLRQLMTVVGQNRQGPPVLVACAPLDQHELGAMMLALMLRRDGYAVYYIGANTPVADLVDLARTLHPVAIMISAASPESIPLLSEQKAHLVGAAPIVAFGGHAFDQTPERATQLGGIYLGRDIPAALDRLANMLRSANRGGVPA